MLVILGIIYKYSSSMKILTYLFLILSIGFTCSCSNSDSVSSPQSLAASKAYVNKVNTKLERSIASNLEARRRANGLKPMKYEPGIASLARLHSEYLVKDFIKTGKRKVNHKGDWRRSDTMTANYGVFRTGENVAYLWGSKAGNPATSFTTNWLNSPPHKTNIMNKWTHTGVGVASGPGKTIYATQLFGMKR